MKKKHFFSLPKLFWKRFFSEDDWFNFNKITAIEKKSEAVSTFFFLPQKGKIGKFKNADYDISAPSKTSTVTVFISFFSMWKKLRKFSPKILSNTIPRSVSPNKSVFAAALVIRFFYTILPTTAFPMFWKFL
ncbi:MAG: hypothetical protein B6D62_04690 [Candidatus Cloacimonas sp. 4484_275]|nr:MAG: hypothetical protein B6D62_04690 [Candidatus Cloacimonas sp. 4484_275]